MDGACKWRDIGSNFRVRITEVKAKKSLRMLCQSFNIKILKKKSINNYNNSNFEFPKRLRVSGGREICNSQMGGFVIVCPTSTVGFHTTVSYWLDFLFMRNKDYGVTMLLRVFNSHCKYNIILDRTTVFWSFLVSNFFYLFGVDLRVSTFTVQWWCWSILTLLFWGLK